MDGDREVVDAVGDHHIPSPDKDVLVESKLQGRSRGDAKTATDRAEGCDRWRGGVPQSVNIPLRRRDCT